MPRYLVFAILAVLLPVKCLFAGDSCFDQDVPGTCTALSNCNSLLGEIERSGKPMSIQMRKRLQKLTCGFEFNEPLVCCLPSSGNPSERDTTINPITQVPTSPTPLPVDEGQQTQPRLGEPPDVQKHPNLRLLPKECGVYDSDRILGGNRTQLYELPWMVLLSYDSARGIKLSCGGTLINEWYVLTAAHCVTMTGDRLKLRGVVLGEHDIRNDPDCERIEGQLFCAPSVRNVSIDTVIAHQGYSLQTLADDIALIRLAQPADFTLDSMKPMCLPITNKLQNENLTGRAATVAGWGATETGLQSPVLLRVDLLVVSNEECQKAFNGTSRISERQICAGGLPDMDSCGGDSGGPLMYPGTVGTGGARHIQRGIVSYGSRRCGLGGLPGVYTRVAYYMDWILDNIRE